MKRSKTSLFMATGRKDMAHARLFALIDEDCEGVVAIADSDCNGIGSFMVARETVVTSKK